MDSSDTPDSDDPKRKKRKVANSAARFEGDKDRFGKTMKESDAGLYLIDREHVEFEKQKQDDAVKEREAARIERVQERAEEKVERKVDREKAACIQLKRFRFIMETMQSYRKP